MEYVRGSEAIEAKFDELRNVCDPRGFETLEALRETMLADDRTLLLAALMMEDTIKVKDVMEAMWRA